MPRTKLDRLLAPKRDPIKGLVLEYMSIQKISGAKVAENIGVGRATFTRRMAEHTDEWPVKDAKAVCLTKRQPQIIALLLAQNGKFIFPEPLAFFSHIVYKVYVCCTIAT